MQLVYATTVKSSWNCTKIWANRQGIILTVEDGRVASGGGEGARRDVGPGGEDLVAEGVQGRRRRRRRDVGDEVGRRRRGERRRPLGPNSIDTFQLEFRLEKLLEFWLEIPYTLRKCSKWVV